ncbi:MAG: NmrA family NAD(P)-binding protein [Saprospiraceae bacterium]
MKNILITGATVNAGMALIKALVKLNNDFKIYAGIRNVEKNKHLLSGFQLKTTHFDFNDTATFKPSLERCDILFLVRPPQISKVTKIFKPLIETAIQCAVKHLVFISVQGVEKSKIIPQYKIEKLIVESNIHYTFLAFALIIWIQIPIMFLNSASSLPTFYLFFSIIILFMTFLPTVRNN